MTSAPVISVVIPTLNEEALLGACLESLTRQAGGFDYEIIVVDNDSTDGTVAIAKRHGARVVREGRRGVAYARSAGFAAAQAGIIASTDADTVVPGDWMARIRERFASDPTLVGMGGIWEYRDGPPAMRALITTVNRIMPVLARVAPWLWSFSGFNFAVRRDAYKACGGFRFDLNYGEDWDLGKRLRRHGKVIMSCDLMVTTSGKAFAKDPLCVRMALNWFSLVVFGRIYLPPLMRRRAEPA